MAAERATQRSFSPLWLLIGGALLLAGSVGWVWSLVAADDVAAVWRALLVATVYTISLAAGMTVWPAIVRVSRGKWATGIEDLAGRAGGFAPVSLLLVAVLWLGATHWAPWIEDALKKELWLNAPFLFLRNLLGLAGFWLLAWGFATRRVRRPGEDVSAAGWLVVVFAVLLSLVGYDLVMAMDPSWFSSLFGGYFFVSSAYMGVAGWALAATVSGRASSDQRHDLGKLVLAFAMLSGYMMFAQLLVFWYENIPYEVSFLVNRLNYDEWLWISRGLLAVWVGPIALLLPIRAKRSRIWLGLVAGFVLLGMAVERWWLVAPTFDHHPAPGAVTFFAYAACIGLLLIGWQLAPERVRAMARPGVDETTDPMVSPARPGKPGPAVREGGA